MFSIKEGSGKHQIELTVVDTPNGFACVLTGGEAPHIGGVALASPRPSLTGEGHSADLWLATIPGHKDMYLAGEVAQALCARLNAVVSVSCGIHIDHATADDLRIIKENSLKAAQAF
ncbi:MAG: hypothetical protein GYA59_01085 [Chloroflexi bacterium]|nr:hypothetical protein [Chloroflexota bacterium]